MWIELGAAGFLIGNYIYHRLTDDDPKPEEKFELPKTEEGIPYSLVYGRCRVRKPVLEYVGNPTSRTVDPEENGYFGYPFPLAYGMDMLFSIGMPFLDGANKLWKVFAGDVEMRPYPTGTTGEIVSLVPPDELQGAGNFERDTRLCILSIPRTVGTPTAADGVWLEGELEFLNGSSTQEVCDDAAGSYAALTLTGQRMLAKPIDAPELVVAKGVVIPGYRGHMLAFLSRLPDEAHWDPWVGDFDGDTDVVDGFTLGGSFSVPQFSFEVSSYRASGIGAPTVSSVVDSGDGPIESNPMDALYDLIVGRLGKLGVPTAIVNTASFAAAAVTCENEGLGFSMAFEDLMTTREQVNTILKQVDGTIFFDTNGQITVRLIRGDYDPNTVKVITPNNCVAIQGYTVGGKTSVPNKIQVTFEDRSLGYQTNTATAQNLANAVSQDGETRQLDLSYPGIKTLAQANIVAKRELGYRGKPIAKCRAIVDRSFRNVVPGDVVALEWPEYGLDGKLFRVGHVRRGTRADGRIDLSLIQDIFFANRGIVVATGGIETFPVDEFDS